MRVRKEIREIEAALRELADPERAAGARRYLKSDLDFLGVTVPELRRIVGAWLREHPELDRRELTSLAKNLWRRRTHELRLVACLLLMERWGLLRGEDLALVEWMLEGASTWAHVDALAVHVAGPLVERSPELASALDRWSRHDSFWLRRSALLALLLPLRRGAGDWRRFVRYADRMLEEKEFFIRKAIGWVLREVAKRDPGRVVAYVEVRLDRISAVTLREAVRRLPDPERVRLTAAYRALPD